MTRIAVIGYGYWGPNLVRNFGRLPNCELATVCDLERPRLESVARNFPGVAITTEFDDVLNDPTIDGVSICTPVKTHFPLAMAALEAGKHVLLAKPMTDTTASATQLVETAKARGLTLQVDHTFIYSPAVRKLRSLIDKGEIGDLLYFDSVRVNLGLFQPDTNVLWDLGPHDLSIMNYLVDQKPVSVSAIGTAHYSEFEDIAYVTLEFEGSFIAHLHLNWLAPVKLRTTLVGGSERMVVYDDLASSDKIRIYDKGVTPNGDKAAQAKTTRDKTTQDKAATDKTRNHALVDYRIGDMYAPHIEQTEPLAAVCAEFVDAIEHGTRPISDGQFGLDVVRVLEAAQQSLNRRGAAVALD